MKIAVFTANENFKQPVLDALNARGHEVYDFMFSHDQKYDVARTIDIMNWADVAFFDFAYYPLNYISNHMKKCPMVCRIHGVDVYQPEFKEIGWKNVDAVIGTQAMLQKFILQMERLGLPRPHVHDINLGCDLDYFKPPEDKEFGYNIGFVAATAIQRKRIYTTLESFLELRRRMPDTPWELHIRSKKRGSYLKMQREEYASYIENFIRQHGELEDSVIWYEQLLPDNIYRKYLQDMDIIWSNSTSEGYQISNAEAMACGTYPIIHNWYGADLIWPKQYLFDYQSELVEHTIEWSEMDDEGKADASLEASNHVNVPEHDVRLNAIEVAKVIEGVV